jgi:2-dehydropantoate 2-reductase
MASAIGEAMGTEASLVACQNGIPWRYFQGQAGPLAGRPIHSVDPDGLISEAIDFRRVIGCIAYCSTEIVRPGVVKHVEGTRFVIGHPSAGMSDQSAELAEALKHAGLKSSVSSDIRTQIWLKAVGNVALNPVSALTGATLGELGESREMLGVLHAIMSEVEQVAAALGVSLPLSIEQRLRGAIAVGDHKTSMLQDLEAGRPLEVDCLTGAVCELADMVGVDVPHTRAIDACVRLLNELARRTQPRVSVA